VYHFSPFILNFAQGSVISRNQATQEKMKFILIDTVQFWYRETWKLFRKCGQDGLFAWQGYIHSETTTCAKAFIAHVRVTVPVRNVIAADVFGTGIFNEISCPIK
jgi:hypothetical protein